MDKARKWTYSLLRRSESIFKTDMVYLARGGFWLTFFQVLTSLASFGLAMLFARYVPKDVYGNYKYVLSLAALVTTFSLTGVPTAVVQAVARGYYGTFIEAVKISLKWNSIILFFSLGLSGYYFLNHNYPLSIAMLIVAIAYPLIRTFGLYKSFLNGNKDFRTSSIYGGIIDISTYALTAIAIFFTESVVILILVNLITQAILNFVFFEKIYFSIPKEERRNVEPGIIKFSKHLSFQNVLANLASQLDKIIIFHYLGAVEVAVYSFAIALPNQVRGAFSNFSLLALPKLSERDPKESVKMLPHRFFITLAVLSPLIILYFIFAPPLFQIFFPTYMEAVPYSRLYIFLLVIMGNLSDTILTTQKEVRKKYILNIYSAFAQIILMLALIKPLGIYGIMIAILVSKYTTGILSYILVRRLR